MRSSIPARVLRARSAAAPSTPYIRSHHSGPPLTQAVRLSSPHTFRSSVRASMQNGASYMTCKAQMQKRWSSDQGENGESKIYAFEDIKNLAAKPDPNKIIIDVREPAELKDTGRIPGALNIPIVSMPDAFFLSEEEFEDRMGFERPGMDKELVVYCKAGVRSRAAAQLARQGGWRTVGEYRGSWMDWVGKGGEVE